MSLILNEHFSFSSKIFQQQIILKIILFSIYLWQFKSTWWDLQLD